MNILDMDVSNWLELRPLKRNKIKLRNFIREHDNVNTKVRIMNIPRLEQSWRKSSRILPRTWTTVHIYVSRKVLVNLMRRTRGTRRKRRGRRPM